MEEAACQIISSQPQIISLQPDSLADIFDDVRRIAKGLGVVPVGEMMVDQLKGRMDVVAAKARELSNKPRVALVEWIEPTMAGGNWMPELIEMAGGINLFGEAGKHSPWMNWEDLVAAEPDIIVVSPCGFDIKRTMEENAPHLRSQRIRRIEGCEIRQCVRRRRQSVFQSSWPARSRSHSRCSQKCCIPTNSNSPTKVSAGFAISEIWLPIKIRT